MIATEEAVSSTGGRTRTYDLRIWNPLLYQLSYARMVTVAECLGEKFICGCRCEDAGVASSYGLSMGSVSVAGAAELHELDRRCALAPSLGFSVVTPAACHAGEDDALTAVETPSGPSGRGTGGFVRARAGLGFIDFDGYLRITRRAY